MAQGLPIRGFEALQQHQQGDREQPYSTARNRTAQCQATLVVKLPLREDASNVEKLLSCQPVAEEVVSLYYTKLLGETVGVRPDGPALALAAATLGLAHATITQHTKVVGGALQVAGCAPVPPQPHSLPPEQLALLARLQPLLSQQQEGRLPGSSGGSNQQDVEHSFARYVRLYTYPFCTRPTLSKASPCQQAAAAAVAQRTALRLSGSTKGSSSREGEPYQSQAAAAGSASSSCTHCGAVDQYGVCELTADQLQELSQPFLVSPKGFVALQQRFAAAMAAAMGSTHSRDLQRWGLATADVAAVGQLLHTPPVIKLAVTLAYYLYTRYIVESSDFPAQLVAHLTAQAQASGKTKGLRRTTVLLAAAGTGSVGAACTAGGAAAGTPAGPAGVDESELPEKWDLGCELLLQRKAEEAAEQLRRSAAAALEAQLAEQQLRLLLPAGCGKHRQGGSHRVTTEADGCGSTDSSRSSSRPVSGTGALLQHQESSCSSRSRSSFAGSVASYKQQVEAANRDAQLLAAASSSELQSCRLSGLLQQWEELRLMLTRSDHGSSFALPVLLMSLAVLMEEAFSSAYPWWKRSSHGCRVMQEVTAAPAQLLDPQCCYQTIMVLAGSPAAVVARQRYDSGPMAAADKRRRHVGVSSVVAAAVGPEPGSPALRRMMHHAGVLGPGRSASPAVSLGADVVHTAAAHKMTRLVKRK